MAFSQEQWPSLLVQNPDGSGGRVPLRENCVLGKAVEVSLKLEFRPAVGHLPIPLAYQQADDLLTLELADVLTQGEVVAATGQVGTAPA